MATKTNPRPVSSGSQAPVSASESANQSFGSDPTIKKVLQIFQGTIVEENR